MPKDDTLAQSEWVRLDLGTAKSHETIKIVNEKTLKASKVDLSPVSLHRLAYQAAAVSGCFSASQSEKQ